MIAIDFLLTSFANNRNLAQKHNFVTLILTIWDPLSVFYEQLIKHGVL